MLLDTLKKLTFSSGFPAFLLKFGVLVMTIVFIMVSTGCGSTPSSYLPPELYEVNRKRIEDSLADGNITLAIQDFLLWDGGKTTEQGGEHLELFRRIRENLVDAFRDDLNLAVGDRELLEFAALMHDIGYYISHSKHHKHALYIIRNADLRGFTGDEIEVMANVARYHRRSTPKSRHYHYEKLQPDLKEKIKKLAAILRIADGLDRSHYQNVQSMEIIKEEKSILFRLITESDAQLEIWGASRKNLLFEEVTGAVLKIVQGEVVHRF